MQTKSSDLTKVTIVVNAHDENLLLHKTLRSLNRNIKLAKDNDIEVEVIIVADKVSKQTLDYIQTRASKALTETGFKLEIVEYGDLGTSRNHGIDIATGEYIGNLDADDLWSDNWIVEAVKTLRQSRENIVVHHAAVLNFGTMNGVWHLRSSTDPTFNPRSIIEDNWWPSCMMTQRSTFDKVRYQRVRREKQFSFEDWLFNSETLLAGIEHIIVPETTMFYRRKQVSMLTAHISGLPTPNGLFTLDGQAKYLKNRKIHADHNGSGELSANITSDQNLLSRDNTSVRRVAIKAIKHSGKFAVKVGKRYAKPYLDSHHRIKNYLKSVRDATRILITDPNTKTQEGRKVVPGWLRDQWYQANAVEPHLFPTHFRVTTAYNRPMMTMGLEQEVYWKLLEDIGNADYILVMPYVRLAGAYKVGVYYTRAYKELHPDERVVILTTENTYESSEDMVPDGVSLVRVPDSFYRLSKAKKQRVLAKVFTNLQPRYVHALHSQEAFQALQRYPMQIADKSNILLSTFNYDYTAEGQKMNAFVAYGDEILPYVTRVFTDNEWVAEDTVKIYGVDEKLVRAHAMPVEISDEQSEGVNLRQVDGKMRVLWAARLAKQKRPDILYDIAKEANKQKLPYEFIVYGGLYDKVITQKFLGKLCKLPNVQYRGEFTKGIQALPTGEFEVYMSTSEAEGTPNAILEAQERSLIVVAPNLGGIPEAINDKKNGMLVDSFDNVNQYLDVLDYIYRDQSRAKKLSNNARKSINTSRSWEAFVKQVEKDLKA